MSTEQEQEGFANLGEVLAGIGLGLETATPEEKMYREQTAGGAPRVDNLRVWLTYQLSVYVSLAKTSGLTLQNSKVKLPHHVGLPTIAREMARHYYYMYYLPRFQHGFKDRPRVNIDGFLDLLMANEDVLGAIKKAQEELDTN